jgi:hypothetical protein
LEALRAGRLRVAGAPAAARLPHGRRGVVACRVKPRIDRTRFGSVTIDGKVFEHDVIIRLDGKVAKRKKRLSKAVYGTSHTISLAEARHIYQKGAARLIIGAGQSGMVALSDEAATYFKRNNCRGGAAADT